MENIKMSLAIQTLKIMEKPTFNKKDISVIMNKVSAGRPTFDLIVEYIKNKYPEYYNRKDKHTTIPRKYAMEYLELYEGIDVNETIKWAKKVKEIGIYATN